MFSIAVDTLSRVGGVIPHIAERVFQGFLHIILVIEIYIHRPTDTCIYISKAPICIYFGRRQGGVRGVVVLRFIIHPSQRSEDVA